MRMNNNLAQTVEASAERLFPTLSLEQVLAKLLLSEAQKNLIKYQTLSRQFQIKYAQDFDAFRQKILHSEPTFEVEQDYFDWELVVTGILDMTKEIESLKGLEVQV